LHCCLPYEPTLLVLKEPEALLSSVEYLHFEVVDVEETVEDGWAGMLGGRIGSSSLLSKRLGMAVDMIGGGSICGGLLSGPLKGAFAIAPNICCEGVKGMHPSYSAGHYCLYTIEVWKSFGLEGLCIFVFLGIYKWSDYAGNNILTMTYSFQADIWLRSILRPFSSSQLKPDNILSPATTL